MNHLFALMPALILSLLLVACGAPSVGEYSCTANPPPQIIGQPATSANVGAQYRYDYTAIYNCTFMVCYDADPIQMPPGATMDHYYDIIYWTPSPTDVNNDFQFTIATPQDPCGNSATQSWVVHVYPELNPPTVISTFPAKNATSISPYASISITFNEAIDPQSVDTSSFLVTNQSGVVNGTVAVNGATAIFTPAARLSYQISYTATITTSVRDLAGNALASNYTWSFSTASLTPISTLPSNGSVGIPINTPIIATFPEPIDPLSVNASSFQVTGFSGGVYSINVPGTYNVSGTTITFTPDAYLSYNTTYKVTMGPSVQNTTGESLSTDYIWTFTTGYTPDTTPPSAPTGLRTGTITYDSLQIMWNASTDNTSILGYNVYRDGVLALTNTSVTSYSDVTFLTLDTPYCYTVTAVDIAGNESASSASLCATPPNLPLGTVAQWGDICSGTNPDDYGRCLYETINTPSQVLNLDSISSISANDHSLALKSDGTVWAWGPNLKGQLGDGTTISHSSPVQVNSLDNVIAISAGNMHSLALKSDGTVWAWGDNSKGELGDGTTTSRSMPVQVSNLANVIAISAGHLHSLALRSDGTVWAWGDNIYGQLLDGTTTSRSTPAQVSNLGNVAAIYAGEFYSLALYQDGTVWRWGGAGNLLGVSQVSGLSGITAISAGTYALALKSDGTVWAWNGSVTGSTTWQIAGLSNISRVSISHASDIVNSLALRQDGTVWTWPWSWGGNDVPVQVNKLNGISEISVGWYSYFALR